MNSHSTHPFGEKARKYWERGLSVIPIIPNEKRPAIRNWQYFSETHPKMEQIEKWCEQHPDCGIGLVLGKASGIVCGDLDSEDARVREIVFKIAPPSPVRKRGGKGEGGFYGFHGDKTQRIKLHPNAAPVYEILSKGCQTVLPPSIHPTTKKPYYYLTPDTLEDFDIRDLPELPLDIGDRLSKALSIIKPDLIEIGKSGRNYTLKDQVSAAIFNSRKSNEEIAEEILRYDQKNHKIPLFSDQDDPQMRNRTPMENAIGFVERIRESIGESVAQNVFNSIQERWPEPISKDAYHGILGEVVSTIEPHTEADPAAIFAQLICGVGNLIGRKAHFQVERTKHFLNVFPAIVGKTGKARKGTSWDIVEWLLQKVDQNWVEGCIQTGLSTGEGLIWTVRDPIKGLNKNEEEVIDPGVTDKRLLVLQSEFASTLRVMGREGNTLSSIIRDAWDKGNLRTMTKNSPTKSTNAHISIIGHITKDELLRYLTDTETANGFGNRFLWMCAKRQRLLPDGGRFFDETHNLLTSRLKEAIEFAKTVEKLERDQEASSFWHRIYPGLSQDRPGLLGNIAGRAEAQVLRLSCIYAVLDQSKIITKQHLDAALAIWDYSLASCQHIFGTKIGDPIGDEILVALKANPQGLSRTEIRDLFGRNKRGRAITMALETLKSSGRASCKITPTEGRSIERWFLSKEGTTNTTLTTKESR